MATSERLFLNLIGHPASGKSTTCKVLGQHGLGVFMPSNHIRSYAQAHGITLASRENSMALRYRMIAEDPDALIRPIVSTKENNVAIDGMRNLDDFVRLKNYGRIAIVAFVCPLETRFQNAMDAWEERGGKDKKDINAFAADEALDAPLVEEVMAHADLTLHTAELTPQETLEHVLQFTANL